MIEKVTRKFILLLSFVILSAGFSLAQERYTSASDEFSLELPTETWKTVTRADAALRNAEFINGDRNDGYLRIRKDVLGEDVRLSDFANEEAYTKLRYLPGFVVGKEEKFAGRLSGITTAYEYTSAGKPMAGRIYYLRADDKTIYSLHFTAAAAKLMRIRNQTDSIARSFKLKE